MEMLGGGSDGDDGEGDAGEGDEEGVGEGGGDGFILLFLERYELVGLVFCWWVCCVSRCQFKKTLI